MEYHIVILAGGNAPRLNNTESRPKPLVDINGFSLISRLILSFYQSKIFCNFHILTCYDSILYEEILEKEIPNIKYKIYDEQKRTGRVGALKFFLNKEKNIQKFFICNGDTLFLNLCSKEICTPIHESNTKPIAYLAYGDTSRNDYKEIKLKNKNQYSGYQNSGLIFLTRNWLKNSFNKNPSFDDIDQHLFKYEESCSYALLSTSILDGGTPARLTKIRDLLN